MYLRFVRLQVREGHEAAFTRFYQERVIPALAATEGCLYAGLLAPWRGEAYQSLTIWVSAESAAAYEESGLYHGLLGEGASMLTDRAEWRVRLARDPLETADPSRREPPSKGYQVDADEGSAALQADEGAPFVRIVALQVAPGRRDDFVGIYQQEVIPALRVVPGCLGIFLAESATDPLGVTSITLWGREEDAVRYEMSGEFERLTSRLRDTFASVYGWGTRLPGVGRASGLDVSSYQVVRGQRLSDIV